MFIDAVVVGPALSGRPRITVEGPQSVAMETSTGIPGKGRFAPKVGRRESVLTK